MGGEGGAAEWETDEVSFTPDLGSCWLERDDNTEQSCSSWSGLSDFPAVQGRPLSLGFTHLKRGNRRREQAPSLLSACFLGGFLPFWSPNVSLLYEKATYTSVHLCRGAFGQDSAS